ncbi:prophage terminase, small subunit [Escherichia coli]|nr:prophage terminase, small subunit [Escherichia coli]
MFSQSLVRPSEGVGEVFRTKPPLPDTDRLLKFLCTEIFLKIIGRKKNMARPPKAPAYLDEIAVRQWKEKSRQLSGREDLTPADWSNLELYCVNYSIYRKAVEDLATRGFSIVNSQGSESRNPALSAKADAERIMIKMASLLGFDPVSRRRNPPETEEEDELDRLA